MAKKQNKIDAGYSEALRRIEECRTRGSWYLNLKGLNLKQLPPEVGLLSKLRELNLSGNQLSSLPAELGRLANLSELYVSSNHLSLLPAEIGQLANLMRLDFSRNELISVPAELGQLRKLNTLSLSRNRIRELPAEIGSLRNLTRLDLSVNEISTLPQELGNLWSLIALGLSSNQLTVLPDELGGLSYLTSLDVSFNRLSTLPRELFGVTSLTRLNLSQNQFNTLPTELGCLTNLSTLGLGQNLFRAFPQQLHDLVNLTTLDLGGNQLSTLPEEIGCLTNLTTLYLGENQLSELPVELGNLTKLTALYLSRNQLSTLPPEFGHLTNLTELYMSGNKLKTVPPEFSKLFQLRRLILEDNDLQELPHSLIDLPTLKELALHGNPNLGLPTELLGPTYAKSNEKNNPPANPRAILDYYFSRLEEGEEAMREVRLLLIGRGRVGKTSLLKALRGEDPDEKEPETPGITVKRLNLSCENGTATGHVWDFGGQEFLHGTHQIFLAERCVYLLVLEGREGNWQIETDYWIRFIQSFGGDSPVIVVLAKYDQHSFSVDQFGLQERCPQIIGFVASDAFTRRGIDELMTQLSETVSNMKDVWLGVPKSWHRVKQALSDPVRTPQNFMEYRDYQELCKSCGVEDEGKQDSLAQTLHRLGVALNFRDHHRLRHTSVLKPEWVTDAIYKLIRYTQQQDSHGVMDLDWLVKALDAEQYPAEKHGFVLELMEKFEVAFPLEPLLREGSSSKDPQRWLIPELLPEAQPRKFEEFQQESVRRLRFSYPEALPPGLIPRLIVRTHEMSEIHAEWRWRSGVVLEWGESKALVRLNRSERRTEVAVIDRPDKDRQSLFDIIRAHLTVLHGNVKVVEETEIEGHPGSWVKVGKLRLLERQGETEFEEYIDEDRQPRVSVSAALDKIESDAATEAAGPNPPRRMKLFVSYAHDNEKELLPMRQHLTLLGQQGYIQVWHDRDLVAGEKWERDILDALNSADIVLLFYTTKARVSRFIQETELPISLERSDKGECSLIWVPLERNDLLDDHPLECRLKDIQSGTLDAKIIYDFPHPQLGWMQVEDSIRRAVELRRKRML